MIPVEDTAVEGAGEGLENTLDFPLPPISCRRKPGGMDSGKYPNLPISFSPSLFASLLFTAICKASPDSRFAFLHPHPQY